MTWLPTFQLDLSDIDPKYNSIIVLDDLMDFAVYSPIIQSCLRKEDATTQVLYFCCRMLFQKKNTTPVSVVTLNIWFYLDVWRIDDRSV